MKARGIAAAVVCVLSACGVVDCATSNEQPSDRSNTVRNFLRRSFERRRSSSSEEDDAVIRARELLVKVVNLPLGQRCTGPLAVEISRVAVFPSATRFVSTITALCQALDVYSVFLKSQDSPADRLLDLLDHIDALIPASDPEDLVINLAVEKIRVIRLSISPDPSPNLDFVPVPPKPRPSSLSPASVPKEDRLPALDDWLSEGEGEEIPEDDLLSDAASEDAELETTVFNLHDRRLWSYGVPWWRTALDLGRVALVVATLLYISFRCLLK